MKKLLLIIFFSLLYYNNTYSEDTLKVFNYYNGLMEYYAEYINDINDKKIEEAYILMYPDKYELNEKNFDKKNTDIENVKLQVKKNISEIRKSSHEYQILMRAEFEKYDTSREIFKFNFLNTYSCLDLSPLNNNISQLNNNTTSVITRGLIFNKINKIKLFFINTEDFNILKYPKEKADVLLKERKLKNETINKEVFLIINIKILPGTNNEYIRKLKELTNNIGFHELESTYFMISKIINILVYNDANFKNKIGYMESLYQKI